MFRAGRHEQPHGGGGGIGGGAAPAALRPDGPRRNWRANLKHFSDSDSRAIRVSRDELPPGVRGAGPAAAAAAPGRISTDFQPIFNRFEDFGKTFWRR